MSTVEKAIEVKVPLQTAYNQFTQFEEFPRFMEGVEEVKQLSDDRLHWTAKIGGTERSWDARITEQVPDMRIAWRGDGEAPNGGVVTFHRISDDTTRVMLQMEFNPADIMESVGDKLGFVSRRVEGDLKRFKKYIEDRGAESGAWRGEINRPGS